MQSSSIKRLASQLYEVGCLSPSDNTSSSGKPFTTPAGHTPKWVERVNWHKASAFEPASYKEFIGNATAVVHTLGILLEDKGYKQAVRDGNVLEVLQALGKGATGSGEASNPLKTSKDRSSSYDAMNRDSGGCRVEDDG